MTIEDGYRIEHDSMGEVRVPAAAKWRAQTQRAVENFPVSGQRIERSLVAAMARIKSAAAKVNAELGVIPDDVAEAIRAAADEVIVGGFDDQFPVDVFQTGSGTSSNMNMNEVLATLATRAARPPGASQRPRERLAEQQRHLPVRDSRRRDRVDRQHTSSRRSITSRRRCSARAMSSPTSSRAAGRT